LEQNKLARVFSNNQVDRVKSFDRKYYNMQRVRNFVDSMKRAYRPAWPFGLEGYTAIVGSLVCYSVAYIISESSKNPSYWQAKIPVLGNPLTWVAAGTALLIPLIDDLLFNCRLLGYVCHAPDSMWVKGRRVVF